MILYLYSVFVDNIVNVCHYTYKKDMFSMFQMFTRQYNIGYRDKKTNIKKKVTSKVPVQANYSSRVIDGCFSEPRFSFVTLTQHVYHRPFLISFSGVIWLHTLLFVYFRVVVKKHALVLHPIYCISHLDVNIFLMCYNWLCTSYYSPFL